MKPTFKPENIKLRLAAMTESKFWCLETPSKEETSGLNKAIIHLQTI